MQTPPTSSSHPGLGHAKGLQRSVERLWVNELTEDLGDTDALVRGRDAFAEPEAGDLNEMLQTIEAALAASPRRTDLWSARFKIYASAGMKARFGEAMRIAWADPRLRAELAWPEIFALWKPLAGGQD